jgi:predicted nucleotide-binding protein
MSSASPTPAVTFDNTSVFIVHGHDEVAKQQAARLVETLGLRAVILHEQPNKGRTIIEKFESHANAAFAIVLLTPDDFGGVKSDPSKVHDRARQNVVLELGFFFGKLGRGRVCALLKGHVEKPSDIDGILYVAMDDKGAWRLDVAKEMRAAGLSVDLNKL